MCENNNYSVFSPQLKRQALDNISARVATFGVRSTAVFGNDAMQVYRALGNAIASARAGEGPAFIEAYTYRWSGHYGPASDDLVGYREASELEAWKRNCPISLLQEAMRKKNAIASDEIESFKREAALEIERCFKFAKSSPFPAPPDWEILNSSPVSPMADKLLAEFELANFDAQQEFQQVKGY
jgi:pyruvate dehydrogenase E1 component alpha subunit